jgi:hypothetical protein
MYTSIKTLVHELHDVSTLTFLGILISIVMINP